MNKIKEARKRAGLTQKQMSKLLEIPLRTIENWDADVSKPTAWAEKLLLKELNRIAEEKENDRLK